jgi:dienelactone hydrolase
MVEVAARLIDTAAPDDPEGIALVLHGGAGRRDSAKVSPTQLSVLRMMPIAERIAHVSRRRLAVLRLLNSVRGWDNSRTPVDDVRWALGRLRERFGELPICLVGHSLGGRAALLSAGEAGVRSVVALAPWLYPDDTNRKAAGKQILFVHGSADRIASPRSSAQVAKALGAIAQVGYVNVRGGKHAMLSRHLKFDGIAADYASATLLGSAPHGAVARVLAGESYVDV